ncbi:MAG: restriction endonuclease subunit S, partial [Flavobacteriaceae bacterium]|nr:restriction endonuclease subunit S [Flavobacteriaceae bacterium]
MSTTTTQKNIPHWQQIVQDKHLDVSVVDSNLLDKELRFESEYFRPSFLDVEEKLKAKNSKSYKQYIKEVRCGPFGSTILHNTYKDSGVLVTRPFNIRNGTIEGENHAFISEEDCLRKNLKFYDKNDIFFARVGAVSCGLVPQFDYKITISPNIIAVRTDGNKLSPEYSSIFFNTIYGESQLLRAQKVVAQPTISTGLIQNILVSIPSKPFQERIAKLVQEAHRERETSKKLYQEAEDLLLSELGMKDWQPTEKNTAIKDSEEVQLYGRADAEFFQPKYDELFEKLEKTASKKLGKIVIYLKGIEPGSNAYAEDGVPFVRVSDVSIHGIENVEKKISAELFEKYKNRYSS